MANTFTKCYIHLVFAVKNRDALISPIWKDELGKYITGIVQNHRHKMLTVYAWYDHIHILIGYNVNQLIPDLVEEIKISTNKWIKEKRLLFIRQALLLILFRKFGMRFRSHKQVSFHQAPGNIRGQDELSDPLLSGTVMYSQAFQAV